MLFMHLCKIVDTYISNATKFRTIAPTTSFNVSISISSFPLEEGDEEVCYVMSDSISLSVCQDSSPHMSTRPLRDEITSGVPTCLESSQCSCVSFTPSSCISVIPPSGKESMKDSIKSH